MQVQEERKVKIGQTCLEECYSKISNLIDAEINNGSKDYDKDFIRKHVEKLTY